MKPRRLDYLCLQPTREGQASFAHVNEIVAGLRRRGWDVRLVEVPHPRAGRGDGFRRALAILWLQIRYWVQCRFRPAPFVYIRDHFLALPTALVAKAAGSIVVQESNGPIEDIYDAWPQLRALHQLILLSARVQLRMADGVVVVTPGLKDFLASQIGRRRDVFVVGNGANVDLFRPGEAEGKTEQPYAVFVGALASWQGIDIAISAAMSEDWPSGVDLVIAGEGREQGRVLEAARATDHIRWLGAIPYRDSAALMSGSLVGLVPQAAFERSRYGLSPLKLYEGMACGVPMIVSDLPGLADTVRAHACGVVVPAGDPVALARAVARVAADPALAEEMGSRGREAVVAEYSWDARAGQTEQVLLRVAAPRGAPRGA